MGISLPQQALALPAGGVRRGVNGKAAPVMTVPVALNIRFRAVHIHHTGLERSGTNGKLNRADCSRDLRMFLLEKAQPASSKSTHIRPSISRGKLVHHIVSPAAILTRHYEIWKYCQSTSRVQA